MYRNMAKEYLFCSAITLLPLANAASRMLGGKSSWPLVDTGLVIGASLYIAGTAYAIVRIKGRAQ